MIIAYQVDPNAIDADKVANYQYNGEEHMLKFPYYLKNDVLIIPTEVSILTKSYHASQA